MSVDVFFPRDALTGSLITIDRRNNAVNDGRMFGYGFSITNATIGTVIDTYYRTGGKRIHIIAIRSALGNIVDITLYDNPTVSTTGTILTTIRNKNRNYSSSDSTQTDLFISNDTTFSTVGTSILYSTLILAQSTNQAQISSSIEQGVEWILEPNSEYLARTTFPGATGETIYTLVGHFYTDRGDE